MDKASLLDLLRVMTSHFTPREEVKVYAIGGTALTLLGLKPSTVDVDFVLGDLNDFITIRAALKYGFGLKEFASDNPERGEQYAVFLKGLRLDLYWGGVDAIVLTDSMRSRARKIESINWIRLMAPSHGDLLLMKLLAGRDKDLDDAVSLARTGGTDSWRTMASELIKQVGLTDRPRRLLSRVSESLFDWKRLRPPDGIHQLIEEIYRIAFKLPRKLVLVYSRMPIKRWEKELSDVMRLLGEMERRGVHVERIDVTDLPKEARREMYLEFAIAPSVLRKYGVRKVFGSRRDPGFLFGDVPALAVYYTPSQRPDEIYPHEIQVGSEEFLPSDFLRIVLRTVSMDR